jgi:hypothetical protein
VRRAAFRSGSLIADHITPSSKALRSDDRIGIPSGSLPRNGWDSQTSLVSILGTILLGMLDFRLVVSGQRRHLWRDRKVGPAEPRELPARLGR